jgi:DNA-binding response OmpR family regulator
MISSSHAATSPSTTHAPAPESVSRCVLLVDDEATLRSALRRYFMRRGWRVCEAEDGEQARALLLDGDVIGGGFDAVITDMRMPRLSGVALHDLVTKQCAALGRRFVFSSGDMGDDDAIAYLNTTRCPMLVKPFELSSLLAAVERVASEATAAAN